MPRRIDPYCEQILKKPHLLSLQLNLTNRCYSRCKSCRKYEWPEVKLDLNLIYHVLIQAKNMGCETYVLSGGEPFAHPQVLQIMRMVNNYGKFGLISSGLIQQQNKGEIIEFAAENAEWIKVSIDGHNSELFREIRGVDAFEQVLKNVKQFMKKRGKDKRPVQINTVISKLNYPYIINIYNIYSKLGCETRFYPVHTWKELMLDDKDWKEVYKLINDADIDVDMTNLHTFGPQDHNDIVKCYIPLIHMVVDSDGFAYPCCRLMNDNGDFIDRKYSYGHVGQGLAVLYEKGIRYCDPVFEYCKMCDRYQGVNKWINAYVESRKPIFL